MQKQSAPTVLRNIMKPVRSKTVFLEGAFLLILRTDNMFNHKQNEPLHRPYWGPVKKLRMGEKRD